MLQPTTIAETSPILVPIDLSAASNKALLLAAQLAAGASRSLVILHVAHDDIHQPNNYRRRNQIDQVLPIEEIAERVLQDFMTDLRRQHPGNAVLANAGLIVVSGLPATRITEVARQTGAGLIVMGCNGRTSLSKLMAGSVSERVIRQCPVPVTIVHANGTSGEDGSIDVRRSEPRRLLRLIGKTA
jgi:nucleotide-binding universal stress UspA family protein